MCEKHKKSLALPERIADTQFYFVFYLQIEEPKAKTDETKEQKAEEEKKEVPIKARGLLMDEDDDDEVFHLKHFSFDSRCSIKDILFYNLLLFKSQITECQSGTLFMKSACPQ